jgi:hypothetical protein
VIEEPQLGPLIPVGSTAWSRHLQQSLGIGEGPRLLHVRGSRHEENLGAAAFGDDLPGLDLRCILPEGGAFDHGHVADYQPVQFGQAQPLQAAVRRAHSGILAQQEIAEHLPVDHVHDGPVGTVVPVDPRQVVEAELVTLSRDHDPGYTGGVARPQAAAPLADGVVVRVHVKRPAGWSRLRCPFASPACPAGGLPPSPGGIRGGAGDCAAWTLRSSPSARWAPRPRGVPAARPRGADPRCLQPFCEPWRLSNHVAGGQTSRPGATDCLSDRAPRSSSWWPWGSKLTRPCSLRRQRAPQWPFYPAVCDRIAHAAAEPGVWWSYLAGVGQPLLGCGRPS